MFVSPLQATRDQILACFEKIKCFGLCHPGMDVVKKTYDGSIAKIDPMFCTLLDAYARRVFGEDLEPKVRACYPVQSSYPLHIHHLLIWCLLAVNPCTPEV